MLSHQTNFRFQIISPLKQAADKDVEKFFSKPKPRSRRRGSKTPQEIIDDLTKELQDKNKLIENLQSRSFLLDSVTLIKRLLTPGLVRQSL